ncbi:hypothetical protein AB0N17_03050 [Streptomyces sp. NPDC051133]|uniref:hypothetical protein n=1 Tax=Streptomyces sp. NPDC051133 TaxID=3155521 RepID=UPI003415C0F3
MSGHERRAEICPDCQATPENRDARIITGRKDETTGDYYTIETWHSSDCPAYTVEQILTEDAIRRSRERTEWAHKAFPAAFERVMKAGLAQDFDDHAKPFVAALLQLLGEQAEDLGRYVPFERWTEILDEHFPPPDGTPTT